MPEREIGVPANVTRRLAAARGPGEPRLHPVEQRISNERLEVAARFDAEVPDDHTARVDGIPQERVEALR